MRRRTALVRSVAIAVACVVLLGLFFLRLNFYVLLSADDTSDPGLRVYQLDDARKLVFGRDVALLINTREQVVLSLSVVGRRCGSLVLWPRDAIQGVVLGDPVQGSADDSYHFAAGGVDIAYATGTRKNVLHVRL